MEDSVYPVSFPRLPEDPPAVDFQCRPLLPIEPPPENLLHPLPTLPIRSTNDLGCFTKLGFDFSTHLFPACYLRGTPIVSLPNPPPPTATKAERATANTNIANELFHLRSWHNNEVADDLQYHTTRKGYPRVLWNVANRFVKRGRRTRRGLTLFLAHAVGFPKENWESTIKYLLAIPRMNGAIDEIWCFESVHHGDSALVNAKTIARGGIFDWADNVRDVLNFFLNYLPADASSDKELPLHLPRLSLRESESRKMAGFDRRRVLAIGHSYGGCSCTLAAIHYPRLISSLIIADPIIMRPNYYAETGDPAAVVLARGAIGRRHSWKNRSEARKLMLTSEFFKRWDPEVLESFLNHGLHATDSDVRLKMSGIQEAIMYTEFQTRYEAYHLLPVLDKNIEILWVMPGVGWPLDNGLKETQWRVWRRPDNASNVRISGAGHLIVQEKPRELAEVIAAFIRRKYSQEIESRVKSSL